MDNIKKIILLFSGNANALNGAANFVRLLNDEMFWESRKIQFTIISNSQTYVDEKEYRKSFLFQLKAMIKHILNMTKIGKFFFVKYEFNILGKNIVNQIIPDEHTCYILNDYMTAHQFFLRFNNKYPTVFLMHNNGDMLGMVDSKILSDNRMGRFFRDIEKEIIDNANRIVFVSETAMDRFTRKHGECHNKCFTINIGLHDKAFNTTYEGEEIRLISVGTLEERKNQIAIIKAVEELVEKKQKEKIHLTLVGGGPMLGTWKKYVMNHKLSNVVRFVGPQSDVDKYLVQSNIFIMSSKDEGLPVAAQEALRAGLALILTDVGGCKELIDDNGYLVSSPDVEEIVNAIIEVTKDVSRIKDMRSRSREMFVEKYTREKMLFQYLQLINNI